MADMKPVGSGKVGTSLKKSFENGTFRNGTTMTENKQISPVLVAFEQELSRFIKYIRKKSEPGPKPKKLEDEPHARGSNTLFSMWNTYEPRLPQAYFHEKLLNTGDLLYSVKEYKLAQHHCYGRYLAKHIQEGITLAEAAKLDVERFREIHLQKGFDDIATATMVLRAILGEAICSYFVQSEGDSKLQNPDTVVHCVDALNVLRLSTQIALHKEEFCWIVFNGTIHIYSIARHLMACGHSSKALEFLLWASMCVESSIPLLTVKYLTWRSTLYTAVCQCYYDIRAPVHAETFARRGLAKVNELDEIEKMSTSEVTPESEAAFRQSKTKMQVMIFRRVVFETRKRPKGLLRPKTKPNLKDFSHQPWPRTPTERLLAEMFQGTAAQFLAMLEALSETHRRTLHCEAPASDAEDTAIDVCGELFFAGMEVIAGGGGARQTHALRHESDIHPSVLELRNTSLMELVAKGENGVPLPALVKFVKRAFGYEQWEPFGIFIEPTLEFLQEQSDVSSLVDIKTLQLMLALEPFYNTVKKPRKTPAHAEDGDATAHAQAKGGGQLEELTRVADVIQSCSEEPFKSALLLKDSDMMVDAALFLWSKCKPHFQRIMSASLDNCKQLLNDVFANRWFYILTVVHAALSWSGAARFDPALSAEVTLKLSLLLECKAGLSDASRVGSVELADSPGAAVTPEQADTRQEKANGEPADKSTTGPAALRGLFTDHSRQMSIVMGGVGNGVREVLNKVLGILDQGLEDIARARDMVIDTSKRNIADVSWIKTSSPLAKSKTDDEMKSSIETNMLERVIETLHMELLFVRHRIGVKLAAMGQGPEDLKKSAKKHKTSVSDSSVQYSAAENELLSLCNKNSLSKAMLLMHVAGHAVVSRSHVATERQTQILQESQELIQKAQQQERKLSTWNRESATSEKTEIADVPLSPLLLYRSSNLLVFKPAPFKPKSGEKVAWYRLFARSASGNNVKVRLNDYQLPGTGEEIPATADCQFIVRGIKSNEKYQAAVAAYNERGKLIGGGIGNTCRPVLAAHPLPTLVAWGYLAQLAFTSGVLPVAKSAASVLWNHFVKEHDCTEELSNMQSADGDLCIALRGLDEEKLYECSPVLARLFLQSVFISVNIRIREGHLFCDSLCDGGPLYAGQVARLEECERLLLAIQVAGWLNDAALCLQAVVQCYGLLAPLIHQKIPAKPVVQVLMRCHAVLQEVPSLTRHRKSTSTSDSLSHMIATITYYIARILRMWNEQGVAGAIIELGKKMLNIETAPDSAGTMTTMQAAAAMATATLGGPPPSKTTKKKTGATKKPKGGGGRGGLGKLEKEAAAFTGDAQNEELKALEAYILKLSQQALNRDDEELTGSEDPAVLYSVVANLPPQQAYKEVLKFKRRTRFLGFYVQVLAKALQDGLTETALEWTNDTMNWIIRRNEMLMANKSTIVRQAAATAGPEEEKIKKFATAIVEFSKPPNRSPQKVIQQGETGHGEEEIVVRTRQEAVKPSIPKKSLVPSTVSRRVRRFKGRTAEEIDIYNAVEKLQSVLPEYWRSSQRRKKLRAVSCEELPWRAQMELLLAGANFDLFLQKIDSLQHVSDAGDTDNPLYRPSFMDPDCFGYATSGTLIVSWAGASMRLSPDTAMGFGLSATETPYSYAFPGRGNPPTSRRLVQGYRVRSDSRVTGVTANDKEPGSSIKSPLFFLFSALENLSRAIVFSYRGKFWMMLQNACRTIWNITQTVLMRVVSGTLRLSEDPMADGPTDVDILRGALWRCFFFGADSLLDMMVIVQDQVKLEAEQNKKRDKVKKGDLIITQQQGLMGGVEDERGGASLSFETPLDSTSALDTRWLKRFILYAAEMLFYEQKWERTISILLRFNALTRSRYAESVLPLLIVAQRKLQQRIAENGGPSKSQPTINVSKETGIAEEFYIKPAEYMFIEPAVHIDPEGHNVYSGSSDALRLVSVPLDINDSLKTLHQALNLKHHTARSLEHSRQLLLCYLAGQQEGSTSGRLHRGLSRVGFLPSQVKLPTDVPLDLTDEVFEAVEDVQTFTLQASQLAVVISSYDKTIEMLQFRKQKSLTSQAMHELGNIVFHSGNIRAAYKWWAESLDTILNATDSLKMWRDITSPPEPSVKPAAVLLQRCGLWGCLLGGVLAANIAQYIHTSNLGLRVECCLLAATFFKALFCSSLPHPIADKDYALYEVGAGHEVVELVPGIDLLSEYFRSDGRSVVAALRWVTEELARARHLITVLPLLTLCLYFTTHVSRDLQRSVDVRILKIRVLTDLGLFSEAIKVLFGLLHGEKLPKTADTGFRTVDKNKTPVPVFNNKAGLLDSGNFATLNYLMDRRLPPALSVLYGQQLTGQLTIAHAHLMVSIAATIYAIPADCSNELRRFLELKEEEEAKPESPLLPTPTQSQLTKKANKKKVSEDAPSLKSSQLTPRKQIVEPSTASPEVVKGFLLATAELILTTLCESLTDTPEQACLEDEPAGFSPVDLEQVCLSRLELAQIASQRHYAVTTGNIVYASMRALEDAAILNELDMEKRSQSDGLSSAHRSNYGSSTAWGGNHYLSSQARCRLDARLWLMCRLVLAQGLGEEDAGMGKLAGSVRSVTSSIGSCLHHCQQGLDEAEAFGDVELMAEFSLLSVVQNLQQGKMDDGLLETLEANIARLEQEPELSFSGSQVLALMIIQYADIKPSSHASSISYLNESIVAYRRALTLLLDQMAQLGNDINLSELCPIRPLRNIYFQQLLPVIDIKLRLGLALTKQVTPCKHETTIPAEWQAAVKELQLGLLLSRISACQRKPIEAQLLLHLGKIQRTMCHCDQSISSEAVGTLLEAVQCSYTSDHDLGLMKQAYLEMAMVLVNHTNELKERLAALQPSSSTETPPMSREGRATKPSKKESKERKDKEARERNRKIETEMRYAWAAIRCAGVVSKAQYKIGILPGYPEITTLKISEKSASSVPSFALFDLLGTDDAIKNSDNGAFTGQNGVVTMGTTISNSNRVQVTWLHLLGYLSVLRRQCSYAALGVYADDENATTKGRVMMPLFSVKKALKLSQMHSFLRNELGLYATECCGVYPPEALSLYSSPSTPQMILTQPSLMNTTAANTADVRSADSDEKSVKAGDFEVCALLYRPELECLSVQDPEDTQSQQAATCFLYALNNKPVNWALNQVSAVIKAGMCHVMQPRTQALHEKLMLTLEMAESDLVPAQGSQTTVTGVRPTKFDPAQLNLAGNLEAKSSSTTGAVVRKKKSLGIRALSARQKKDDHIKVRLKEHLSEVRALLQLEKPAAVEEVPFEVNLQNVSCLEAMFDPSRGTIGKTTEAFYTWLYSLLENNL